MLALLLALSLLAGGARAACNACVDGYCHERHTILAGFSVTDQLAIDKEFNILYLQINENLNTAVMLNRGSDTYSSSYRRRPTHAGTETRLVEIRQTKGMTFNPRNHQLYLGSKESGTLFFKSFLPTNTTEAVPNTDEHKFTNLLYSSREYELVFTESFANNTSAFHFLQNSTNEPKYYTKFVNYPVSDFAITKDRLLFVSKNTLYAYELPALPMTLDEYIWPETPSVILKKDHIIVSTSDFDEFSNIYVGDSTKKVIYRLDSDPDQKPQIYAAYDNGYIEDFVLDSIGNIIFRDADGSVGEFVKEPFDTACVVEPPHDTYYIRQSDRYQPRPDTSGYASRPSWNSDKYNYAQPDYEYNRYPANR